MKLHRKWKPGGRPRRKNTTKRWLLQQQAQLAGKEMERFLNEPPIVLPKHRKKGA